MMKNGTRTMTRALLLAFLFFPAARTAQGQGGRIVKLSENLFRIASDSIVFANMLVFSGRDGVLLVDTGERYPNGPLAAILKKLKPSGVKAIINTHLHDDHIGGNEALGKNATVINFFNLEQWASKGVLLPGRGELKGRTGRSFAGYYRLAFSGEEIFIVPAAGGHSEADVIVYLKGSGIVHLGDLLFADSFPLLFGDADRYQEILEKAIDTFPAHARFVAGHGRDYTMAELKEYRKVLAETRRIVERELKGGKSIESIIQANPLKQWESYGNAFPLVTSADWIAAVGQAVRKKKR
jgi:glyoxylase-like metal-dependent hydrolase (beta-lactamase superfamily II)